MPVIWFEYTNRSTKKRAGLSNLGKKHTPKTPLKS